MIGALAIVVYPVAYITIAVYPVTHITIGGWDWGRKRTSPPVYGEGDASGVTYPGSKRSYSRLTTA
jgi:hypothetical protein